MSEPQELNEVLQGRKILGVEPGATPGWMIVNLELNAEEREARPEPRLFLTVFIGGRKGSPEANHHSTSALYYKVADGRGEADMIRDGRDPEMPLSSAGRALGDTGRAPERAKSEVSNVEDLTPKANEEAITKRVQALRCELEHLGRWGIVSWNDGDIIETLERAGADPTPENVKAVREHFFVEQIADRMTEVGFDLHRGSDRLPGIGDP